jgi:signal transduction histidine kinase
MNWSNWEYLGVGLTLGMGLSYLFGRLSNRLSSPLPSIPISQPDASEILQQMKQTELAYQMAQEMSHFKAGFLARTTHELRSPLNGLIGLHQLILSDLCEDTTEEREFISQAHDRALQLLKLIDEILSVARTEQGTNKLNIQPLLLAEVLEEVYNLTHLLAKNRNYPFELVAPEAEIYVLADPRWLRQVLINLIETSIAGMEEDRISLSSNVSAINNSVYICLDVPTHALEFSEAIDLIKSENRQPDNQTAANYRKTTLSPGMKLLLNQTLMEVMGGKLEIVSLTGIKEKGEHTTRLQISIPLMNLEAEFPQLSAS